MITRKGLARSLQGLSLSVLAPLAALTSTASPPQQGEALELWLSDTITRCPSPLTLDPDRQLTLELPEEVQVAAPTRRGYLELHIAPQLVVVQALLPNVWRRAPKVGVSLILKGGARLYCEFQPPSDGGQQPQAHAQQEVSVVRFHVPSRHLNAQREALKLIHSLERGLPPERGLGARERLGLEEVSRALQRVLRDAERSRRLKLLSAHALELSALPPLRAQEQLIYLTLTQRLRLGGEVWVRAQLLNRSQPPFTLESLSLALPTGDMMPLSFEPKGLTAPPDGRAHIFAFSLPASTLKSGELPTTLSVRSSDGRQLSLTLPEEL